MYKQITVIMIAIVAATGSIAQAPSGARNGAEAPVLATESISGTILSLAPRVAYQSAVLRIAGPEGYELTKKFDGSEVIFADVIAEQSTPSEPASTPATAQEALLGIRDGRYYYSITVLFADGGRRTHSGSFKVSNGAPATTGAQQSPSATKGLSSADAPRLLQNQNEVSTEASESDLLVVDDTAQDGETFLQLDSFPSGANFKSWLLRNDQGTLTLETADGLVVPADIMTFVQSGDVVVGASAPLSDLTVVGNGGNLRLIDDDQPNPGNGWDINDEGVLRFVAAGMGNVATLFPAGGMYLGPSNMQTPSAMLHVEGSGIIEGDVSMGSSRTIKHQIEPLDEASVLNAIRQLPIYSWKYKKDKAQASHAGPMAEDMFQTFRLGRDDKHLSPSDSAGLALAAIKGVDSRLDQEVRELRETNAALTAANRTQDSRIQALEKMLQELMQKETG